MFSRGVFRCAPAGVFFLFIFRIHTESLSFFVECSRCGESLLQIIQVRLRPNRRNKNTWYQIEYCVPWQFTFIITRVPYIPFTLFDTGFWIVIIIIFIINNIQCEVGWTFISFWKYYFTSAVCQLKSVNWFRRAANSSNRNTKNIKYYFTIVLSLNDHWLTNLTFLSGDILFYR